jgi:hypothetical protein
MGRFLHFVFVVLVAVTVMGATALAQPAGGPAQVVMPWAERPVEEGLGWRFGVVAQGLFNSNQNWPFTYLNLGVRYKTDAYYVDLHAPLLVVGLDMLSTLIQGGIGVNKPFFLFDALNTYDELRYAEGAILKLGQSFPFDLSLADGSIAPMRFSFGLMAVAELVAFDTVERDLEEFEELTPYDPMVIAPGAFVALGGKAPMTRYDLSFGAGLDVYDPSSNTGAPAWVLFLDLDVQFSVRTDVAIYIRNRLSTYVTDIDAWIFTNGFSGGITWRFF